MASVTNGYGRSDTGLVRPGNEDYLIIDDSRQLYIVCDGMGGHQAGEVASVTAVETIARVFQRHEMEVLADPRLNIGQVLPPKAELLVKAVRLASRAVFTRATADTALSGMGTTVVAAVCEADTMALAHVGDSRAYRLCPRKLEPLTRDHSWVEELQSSQRMTAEEANSVVGKNVITRALGVRETVEVDLRIVKIAPGDLFILCSDGLCGFADDDEIFEVATKFREDPRRMSEALVQMANDRGGADNVTVVVIEVKEAKTSPLPGCDPQTFPAENTELLTAEDEWLIRLAEEAAQEPPESAQSGNRSPSRRILLAIFFLVIVIAVVVFWLQSD